MRLCSSRSRLLKAGGTVAAVCSFPLGNADVPDVYQIGRVQPDLRDARPLRRRPVRDRS